VLLDVSHGSDTPRIVSLRDENGCSESEFAESTRYWFSGCNVDLDGVVDLCLRIRVSDGASVVSDNGWNALGPEENFRDTAQFPGGLLEEIRCNTKRPLVSSKRRNLSLDFSISTTSMRPAG